MISSNPRIDTLPPLSAYTVPGLSFSLVYNFFSNILKQTKKNDLTPYLAKLKKNKRKITK